MIYTCLNRTVLFILSRRSNKWEKVEALKKLRSVRSVIFGSGNHQQEFFGCLVHVLMQLVDGLPISLEGANKTQWHVTHEVADGKEQARVLFCFHKDLVLMVAAWFILFFKIEIQFIFELDLLHELCHCLDVVLLLWVRIV